jgi:glycosyltransferase involved in cell wall biosynthesis
MKKVLLNLPSQWPDRPTGVARFAFALLQHLIMRGAYRYALCTQYAREELPGSLRTLEFELIRARPTRSYASGVAWQTLTFPRLARAHEIDLVLNADPLGTASGGKRRITVVHDLYFKAIPEHMPGAALRRSEFIHRLVLGRSHRVIAVSEVTRQDVARYYPRLSHRLETIHSDAVESIPLDEAVPHHGILQPYILAVGNATPNKNFGLLLDAMASVAARHPGVALVHVGIDPAGRLAAGAAAAGVKLVRLEGVDDRRLASLYRGALGLCVPSFYEGFCLPLLEAQKQGCPTLYSSRSATAEIGGAGGLSFDPYDADALARLLGRLIAEPALRTRLRDSGFENAKRFSWTASAERYERAIQELLSSIR